MDLKEIWKPKKEDDLALLPCPFCGGDEIVYGQYDTVVGPRWMVFCCSCMGSVDPGYAQERHVVQRMWNRRADHA